MSGRGLYLNQIFFWRFDCTKTNQCSANVFFNFAGSGLLSVMGISFAYIPVGKIRLFVIPTSLPVCGIASITTIDSSQFSTAQHVLTSLQTCSCGGTPCQVNGSCQQCTQVLEGKCYTGEEAYGAILGTVSTLWYIVLQVTHALHGHRRGNRHTRYSHVLAYTSDHIIHLIDSTHTHTYMTLHIIHTHCTSIHV